MRIPLTKPIGMAALALTCAAATLQAATISGEFTSDNYHIVYLDLGGTLSPIPPGVTGPQWNNAVPFSVEVPNDQIDHCSIRVVVWNDNSSEHGLAGFIFGPDGALATGDSEVTVLDTDLVVANPANGEPSIQDVLEWTTRDFTEPNVAGHVEEQAPWAGAVTFGGMDSGGLEPHDIFWIWGPDGINSSDNTYQMFNFPCPAVVTAPVQVEGEHYQCYKPFEMETTTEADIFVQDQFGGGAVTLGKPVLHCNPAAKAHGDQEFGIINPEVHLVCYDVIQADEIETRRVRVNNQIGPDEYTLSRREMFCVPSLKEVLQ